MALSFSEWLTKNPQHGVVAFSQMSVEEVACRKKHRLLMPSDLPSRGLHEHAGGLVEERDVGTVHSIVRQPVAVPQARSITGRALIGDDMDSAEPLP